MPTTRKKPLTWKQLKILEILHINFIRGQFSTPTEIGEAAGKQYYAASSWACQGLKSLINRGFAISTSKGTYQITAAGREFLIP